MTEPALEIYRAVVADELLNYANDIVQPRSRKSIDLSKFHNVVSRWLLNNRCYDADCDSLLPHGYDNVDVDLDEYLAYHGVSGSDRDTLENGFIDLSEQGIRHVKILEKMLDNIDQKIDVLRYDGVNTILIPRFEYRSSLNDYSEEELLILEQVLTNPDIHRVRLRTDIYDNLLRMYGSGDEDKFHRDLYSMLKRYDTLGIINIHNMLSENFIDMLVTDLGLKYQVFSHPILHDRLEGGYMSMYPDTDKIFDSIGTYHELKNLPDEEIVALAKIPFTSTILNQFIDFIDEWFKTETRPVTLIVVIPTWPDAEVYNNIVENQYVQVGVNVAKDEHRFRLASTMNRASGPVSRSMADTTILIMQNEEAQVVHPIPNNIDQSIRTTLR